MRQFLRRVFHPSIIRIHDIEEIIMSDITDKLDAATAAAIAKIQAAGDTTALQATIDSLNASNAKLEESNADLQAQLDAVNADAVKNTDALNAATAPAV